MKYIYLVRKTNSLKTTYKVYSEYTTAMKEFRKHCKKMNDDQDNYDIKYSVCMSEGIILPDNEKPQAWFSVGCDENRELVELFCLETMYGGEVSKKVFILKVKTSVPEHSVEKCSFYCSDKSAYYSDNPLVKEEYLVFNNRDIAIKRLDVYVDNYKKSILLPNQFSLNDIMAEDLLVGDNTIEFLIIDINTSVETDARDTNVPPVISRTVRDAVFEDKLTRFHYEGVKQHLIKRYTEGLYDSWMDFIVEHETGEKEKVDKQCMDNFGVDFSTLINSSIPYMAAKFALKRWTSLLKVDWSEIFEISREQENSGDEEILIQCYDEEPEEVPKTEFKLGEDVKPDL